MTRWEERGELSSPHCISFRYDNPGCCCCCCLSTHGCDPVRLLQLLHRVSERTLLVLAVQRFQVLLVDEQSDHLVPERQK